MANVGPAEAMPTRCSLADEKGFAEVVAVCKCFHWSSSTVTETTEITCHPVGHYSVTELTERDNDDGDGGGGDGQQRVGGFRVNQQ